MRSARFTLFVLSALVVPAANLLWSPAGVASGYARTQVDTIAPSTTQVDLSECAKPAIQKPNCGVKPQQAGDRGGALQYTVWAILIAGLGVVFAVVFRSAARTNRRKTAEVAGRDWS